MEVENNVPNKRFLIDEEAKFILLPPRSSYPKKIWELLLQQSTTLGHKTKSGIKNAMSRVFLILPSIKSLTLAFILFALVLLLVSFALLLKENGLAIRYPFGNKVAAIDVPIKEDNTEAVPKNLTLTTLEKAKKSEPFCEAMKNCFDRAIKEFISEPEIVKENAKMTLECNGTRKEFVSGKGENHIEVFWVGNQTHYAVREANSQVYVARLGRQTLPLNLGSLLKVYQQLVSVEGWEELRQCLNKTIEEFPKEPQAVQDNAVLVVSCGGSNVTFRSEGGKTEISVYKDMQGKVVFHVNAKGGAWWARLFIRH